MAEPRGNHLAIDGGQVKEDEHIIASYKPIPEVDSELRTSKHNLTKSKEKVSSDGAEEKLLQKEDEAKITTRVDMADAKYVVEDHRNGDAKIELDANKRQFSGLTKEELMKYADDPFWVRLRWFMFILFWALWLCMLAGAIAIIVRAPKCAPPPPKTWFQKGPLVDATPTTPADVPMSVFMHMSSVKAPGLFVAQPDPYAVLDDDSILKKVAETIDVAKKNGFKIILDLAADFVSTKHRWFELSLNRTAEFATYFIWANSTEYDASGNPKPPNNWVSKTNTEAWTWSEDRKEFYYHQYESDKPQLNFSNPLVVRQFDEVLKKFMKTGAAGVRLQARELLVDSSLAPEVMAQGQGADIGADHTQYSFWRHQRTSDQPGLDSLLLHWAHIVDSNAVDDPNTGSTVFTVAEEPRRTELYLLQRDTSYLRPPTAAPLDIERNAADVARELTDRVKGGKWPAVELAQTDSTSMEAAALFMLLPAAPVLRYTQLDNGQMNADAIKHTNESGVALEQFSRLVALRSDASIEHGNYSIAAVPALNSTEELLVCARWKPGHTGYVAVWNPTDVELYADLSSVHSVPPGLTLHYASPAVKLATQYTLGQALKSDKLLVPGLSTVVLSYVPKSTAEK